MIPNDANISEASALIAITAPELTQPCGRQTKKNAGVRRPRPVWEENFKTSVLFVTTSMYRPTGSLRCRDRLEHRLCGGRRNAGELDPRAARLSRHKVHLRALARSFRRKLDHGAGPCRDTFVQGVKCVAVHNLNAR